MHTHTLCRPVKLKVHCIRLCPSNCGWLYQNVDEHVQVEEQAHYGILSTKTRWTFFKRNDQDPSELAISRTYDATTEPVGLILLALAAEASTLPPLSRDDYPGTSPEKKWLPCRKPAPQAAAASAPAAEAAQGGHGPDDPDDGDHLPAASENSSFTERDKPSDKPSRSPVTRSQSQKRPSSGESGSRKRQYITDSTASLPIGSVSFSVASTQASAALPAAASSSPEVPALEDFARETLDMGKGFYHSRNYVVRLLFPVHLGVGIDVLLADQTVGWRWECEVDQHEHDYTQVCRASASIVATPIRLQRLHKALQRLKRKFCPQKHC